MRNNELRKVKCPSDKTECPSGTQTCNNNIGFCYDKQNDEMLSTYYNIDTDYCPETEEGKQDNPPKTINGKRVWFVKKGLDNKCTDIIEEIRRAEEERRAEQLRIEEERRIAEEARRAEEQRARAEEARRAEEQRVALEAARAEEARLEEARLEAARAETARAEEARLEAAREETARIEAARAETARIEAARAETARIEAARRAEEERQEAARVEEARRARIDEEERQAQRYTDAQSLIQSLIQYNQSLPLPTSTPQSIQVPSTQDQSSIPNQSFIQPSTSTSNLSLSQAAPTSTPQSISPSSTSNLSLTQAAPTSTSQYTPQPSTTSTTNQYISQPAVISSTNQSRRVGQEEQIPVRSGLRRVEQEESLNNDRLLKRDKKRGDVLLPIVSEEEGIIGDINKIDMEIIKQRKYNSLRNGRIKPINDIIAEEEEKLRRLRIGNETEKRINEIIKNDITKYKLDKKGLNVKPLQQDETKDKSIKEAKKMVENEFKDLFGEIIKNERNEREYRKMMMDFEGQNKYIVQSMDINIDRCNEVKYNNGYGDLVDIESKLRMPKK